MTPIRFTLNALMFAALTTASLAHAQSPASGEHPLMGIEVADLSPTPVQRADVRADARTQQPEAGDVTRAQSDLGQGGAWTESRLAQPHAKPLAGEQA